MTTVLITDSGSYVENTKARVSKKSKELGKMTL